jgi:hypothetical protein
VCFSLLLLSGVRAKNFIFLQLMPRLLFDSVKRQIILGTKPMNLKSMRTIINFTLIFTLCGCASLEERLCNQTVSYQKGYDDVINGRQGSPGLAEGQACKDSQNYSTADYHRDYMAGFNKAKAAFCTQASATAIGTADAASGKALRDSVGKLAVCLADESIKVNLESFYEIGYRKEFCKVDSINALAVKDAANYGENQRPEKTFQLCAYQKTALFKSYSETFAAELRKQCSPSRAGSLGATYAREKKPLSTGLALLEKCPNDLMNSATQSYSAAYQMERSQIMEEERLKMEQQRLAQEEANRQEILRIRRRELELQQQQTIKQ